MSILKYVVSKKLLFFAKLEEHLFDIALVLFEWLKLVSYIVAGFRSVLLVRLFDAQIIYA